MPVESRPMYSSLQLTFNLGTDQQGRSVLRRRSFSNIKSDVDHQDVFDIAVVIQGLQTKTLQQVLLNDRTELVAGY